MPGTVARRGDPDTWDWWHVIDLPDGSATPGGWDLRALADRIPWPDLAGKRCLDVGTADGFWAFELERRGAADVLATDLASPFQARARERFEHAHDALGSRVRYEERDVFELEGDFDVVFMGYVLQMVRDPVGALEAARRVCRGHLLLLDTVSLPLSLLPAPLGRLDARHDGREWFVFNPRGLRKAVEMAGWSVEAQTGILREAAGPLPAAQRAGRSWKYRLRARGCSCALRAAPTGSGTRFFGRSG
ncbi:MAG TPA: class I SAM-dependent methyltransferase [Gaiellaceae bacterium]|nr:class I SAM-dependent methyltransferase [Gaiellaceae bacterium]